MRTRKRIVGTVFFAGLLLAGHAQSAPPAAPYLALFPDFSPELVPVLPGDVATQLKASLERDGKFALVQRLFDLYAWQMFIAVNWPLLPDGTPAPSFTAAGPPRWTGWATSDELFRPDSDLPQPCRNPEAADVVSEARSSDGSGRTLRLISSVRDLDVRSLASLHEPVDGPLIDQHGHFVYYESLLDPNETAFICENRLYQAAGQAAYMAQHHYIAFPAGEEAIAWSGSFSIKLAWKVLDVKQGDRPARFFTMPATTLDLDAAGRPIERRVLVGLVGMHIVHKSLTAPQRIWATFEQVDNLAVDPVAHPGLRPSFFDPDCTLCVPNQPPQPNAYGRYSRRPVQVMRTIPIAPDTAHLDREARAVLAQLGSVWRYYRLIGTEWPTVPGARPAGPNAERAEAILNRSGGAPTPPFLANVTMETCFQAGVRPACTLESLAEEKTCAASTPPPGAARGSTRRRDRASVFGGPGCMSCHAGADAITRLDPASGRPVIGGPLSGDFSWFLTRNIAAHGPARP